MWIAYDIDFGDIEARYHIKQFGEAPYEKQVREKAFGLTETRDKALAEYLAMQPLSETH
jgi:hypothetical protein